MKSARPTTSRKAAYAPEPRPYTSLYVVFYEGLYIVNGELLSKGVYDNQNRKRSTKQAI